MTDRKKLPTLSDYSPTRVRPGVEADRLRVLFPPSAKVEERMTRVESVVFDVVQAQIEAAPKIAAAHDYVNDETNARTSAMAHARAMHNLLVDVKRTQRVSESRTKLLYVAIGSVVLVIIAGMWTKTDPTTLVTLAGGIAGVALAVVNFVAKKSGQVRDSDTIPPPPQKPDDVEP